MGDSRLVGTPLSAWTSLGVRVGLEPLLGASLLGSRVVRWAHLGLGVALQARRWVRLGGLRLRVSLLLLCGILVGLGVLRIGLLLLLLLLLIGWRRLGLLLRLLLGLRLGFGLGRGLLDGGLLLRRDDRFGLVRRRVDLLLAFRAWRGHVDAQSPLHLTVQAQPLLHLSQMWVGVESTLVADRGLTLCAGVVVGDSRWVGQLCGGADRTELTAGHRSNLWQRRIRRGGGQTAVWRH